MEWNLVRIVLFITVIRITWKNEISKRIIWKKRLSFDLTRHLNQTVKGLIKIQFKIETALSIINYLIRGIIVNNKWT